MKKSELKNGMIVEYKNGKKRMFINNTLIGVDIHNGMDNYREDLTNEITNEHDIVEVFEFEKGSLEYLLTECKLTSIWKRKKEVDWRKVQFGTKVRCWDNNDGMYRHEGVFLEYLPEETYEFRVYVRDSYVHWQNCELIEEEA